VEYYKGDFMKAWKQCAIIGILAITFAMTGCSEDEDHTVIVKNESSSQIYVQIVLAGECWSGNIAAGSSKSLTKTMNGMDGGSFYVVVLFCKTADQLNKFVSMGGSGEDIYYKSAFTESNSPVTITITKADIDALP
jgi:uncharacterized lipoprotein YehR (DUF1307 family)